MARENQIVLSDTELECLKATREEMFGSEEMPYGVVVERACNHWQDHNDGETDA